MKLFYKYSIDIEHDIRLTKLINLGNNCELEQVLAMSLTGKLLKEMIFKSFEKIDEKSDYLNKINVFPVPDGDTGLNLFSTMKTIVEELEKKEKESTNGTLTIKEASRAIARGAFMGAKGNSGVILSQFFVGFAKTIEDEAEVTPNIFADALIEGSRRAYKAVMNPREGTILTVVKETAQAAKIKATEGAHWKEIVEHCYHVAQLSTMETPNLLEELKKANVVDAGALGFVYLIQGWLFVLANSFNKPHVLDMRQELENSDNSVNISHSLENMSYKYCTEAMLFYVDTEVDIIKEIMKAHGDSLLVIADGSEIKLHIHTNNPRKVILDILKIGQLQAVKIDDMRSQMLINHS